MKVIRILTVFSVTILFFSCNKVNGVPKCINDKINAFDETAFCDSGSHVDEYSYQGETVYLFAEGDCGADMASEVVNSSCETLGYIGGIAGNTIINGDNFNSATFESTVWKQ